jgi:hypothetical protein
MPTIFDLLYREYCRARLAEMRKQLLIARATPQILQADDPADQGSGSRRDTRHETRQVEAAVTRTPSTTRETTMNTPELYTVMVASISSLTIVALMVVGAW